MPACLLEQVQREAKGQGLSMDEMKRIYKERREER
jgi:hypothetical protein